MLRIIAKNRTMTAVQRAMTMAQRSVSLQSHKPCATLPDKILRGEQHSVYYKHPSYVMSREKNFTSVWYEIGFQHLSYYLLVPFFTIALVFKA